METLDQFAYILTFVWNEIINRPFLIAGHIISFAQIFIYTALGSILLWMISEVFDG